MLWLETLSRVAVICLLLETAYCMDPGPGDIDKNELRNVFQLMRKAGEARRGNWNQHLVVAVLSQQEMKESKNWNSIGNLINDNRIKFFLNKRTGCDLDNPDKPNQQTHGEIICLYGEDGLEAMLKKFQEIHKDTFPNVLMFSHYIPCALVKGTPYSCSEELAKEALANRNRYKMFVSFETVFLGTDGYQSYKFMCQGNEKLCFSNDAIIEFKYMPPNTKVNLFQPLFLKCLQDTTKVIYCKQSNKCIQICDEFTLFTDDLSYTCTASNKFGKGKLSERGRWEFFRCAQKYINTHIHYCNRCYQTNTIGDVMSDCTVLALDSATDIGEKDQNGGWKQPMENVPWNKRYMGVTRPLCNPKHLYCNRDINKLCDEKIESMTRFGKEYFGG